MARTHQKLMVDAVGIVGLVPSCVRREQSLAADRIWAVMPALITDKTPFKGS